MQVGRCRGSSGDGNDCDCRAEESSRIWKDRGRSLRASGGQVKNSAEGEVEMF